MSTKRILFVSDMHCGSHTGLCPPAWQVRRELDADLNKYQRDTWRLWQKYTAALGKLHMVVCVGDLVDGQSHKDRGIGCITTDVDEQCDMALACLRHVVAPVHEMTHGTRMVYGTGYHVRNDGMQAERAIAAVLGATIGARDRFSVNGYEFEVKHKAGGSQAISGGDATLRNAMAWEDKRAVRMKRKPANAIVRGHNHRWRLVEDADKCAVILPCLAGSTDFGALNCEAVVDWGLAWCDIDEDGNGEWHRVTHPLEQWLPKCEDCS